MYRGGNKYYKLFLCLLDIGVNLDKIYKKVHHHMSEKPTETKYSVVKMHVFALTVISHHRVLISL